MIYVFDASALIAYLRDETGGVVVERLLLDPQSDCFAHALNLCEVFYDFARAEGEAGAQSAIAELRNIGVIERADLDVDFWQEAGRLKADYRRISLADCCAVALTLRLSGELVTSDHHELDPLAAASVCPILFFR